MNNVIKEQYRKSLAAVCRITGVDECLMFSTNREESVDARAMLSHVLSIHGFSDAESAELTGLSRQCINKLKNSIRYRRTRWAFKVTLQQICAELATD